MRQGRWKLLCDYDGSRPELYDVTADPGETKDLAEANPEIVAFMTERLLNWWRSMPGMEK